MAKVWVSCSRCDLEFPVRDNGYDDPSTTVWCPVCGSRELRRVAAIDVQTVEPQEAA